MHDPSTDPGKEKHLPAIRPETRLAFQEARTMMGRAVFAAAKTNLAFLACSGLLAYRSGQRFWECKGRSWWARTRAFAKIAWLALKEDAFGSDVHIETLDLDRALDEGGSVLSLPSRPEDVASHIRKP